MKLTGLNKVTLPIGILHNGEVYRTVEIDEMRGYDDKILGSKQAQANGARALTQILQRCIVEIEGVFPRKKSLQTLAPESIVRGMFLADRDFLLMAIRALAIENDLEYEAACPACKVVNHVTKPLEEFEIRECTSTEIPPKWEIPLGAFKRKMLLDGVPVESVIWTHPTGAIQEEIVNKVNSNGSSVAIAACCSIKVGDKIRKITLQEADEMPTRFRQYIISEADKFTPGIVMSDNLTCASCGHVWEEQISQSVFFSQSESGPR